MNLSRALLLPLAGALLLAGCGEQAPIDRQKAAQAAIDKGDFNAALIELKSALQSDPNSGALRLRFGSLLLETGDAPGAVLELRKALDQGYKDDVVTARLATALVASGKLKEVTDSYAQVSLTDDAARAELQAALAAAWLGQRSLDRARAAAAEALKATADFGPALLIQARLAALGGQFDEALALADRAVAKGPAVGDAHLLRATLLLAGKKDRAGAIAAFEQGAKFPAAALGARSNLVQLHLSGRDLPKAKAELALLQKSHPRHPNTAYLGAVLAYSQGDMEKVETLTEALLKVAPDSPDVLTLSGAGHLRRGALAAAESKLGRVVQTVEQAPLARRLLAETYLKSGQPDRALSTLGPLLAGAADADVLALSAQAHLQKGQLAEAEAAFRAALQITPDDVRLRTSMALADLARGKSESAFDALQQLAKQDSGQTADLALINAHLHRREFDQALSAIDALQKKLPKSAMPLHLRGVALLGKADAAGARQAFEAALAAEPSYFASMAALVSLHTKAKQFDAAQARVEAAVKRAPQDLPARMLLIDVLRAKGSPPDQVLQAVDEAVRRHPTEAGPHLAKLAHLAKHRSAKDAAGHAQVALAALPNHPQILDAAGRALAAAGDEQQALLVFNRLTAAMPRSALPYLRLADVHGKRGNRSEVTSMLNRAFEVQPESLEVHRRLLEQASRSKDYKAVLAAAKDLQRRRPQSALGYLLEGEAESLRKGWSAAKAAYRSALSKADGEAVASRAYYAALKRSGDAAQASRFADDWLRSRPKDVNLRGLLGSDALMEGRLADAERWFREIVEIEPRSSAALNNLAWLMAERKDPMAVQMAERAVGLAPSTPESLDTLARALEVGGHAERAVAIQLQAVEASDGHPAYQFRLVRLLARQGDKDRARSELRRLLDTDLTGVDRAALVELKAQLGM